MLKVLDFQSAPLLDVPINLESLINLKYLSFRDAEVGEVLPKSIGMLQNLETLDVKYTDIHELPKEISKLRKLRHFIGSSLSLIKLNDGIGDMTSLQTLHSVDLDMDGVVNVIKELGKMKQIRQLGLICVRREDLSILSSSINEMQHLEKLYVSAKYIIDESFIDLHLISAPTILRKLKLRGRLQKLPVWIPELQNLVGLRLEYSNLTKDSMQSLKSFQNLVILSIHNHAYEGLCLHIQDEGFPKLKELYVGISDELRDIVIEKGALLSLKKFQISEIP